ncbi:MAG TPA: cation diffusion facilitator family transporter [Caulobacteraceae bacterium]|nr:cation diffusion facilitator family transporter [Caulobacteraceae bacterium]
MAEPKGSLRVVLAALAGNFAIAAVKFVTYAFTGSTSILTEGIHSLVDTGDQLLLLLGQARAKRPADDSHPFGYGMETYFWSFIVALMIFLVGGAVSVWEGAEKLVHPSPMRLPWVSLGVVAASAMFEGLSFRVAYREFRRMVRGRDVRVLTFVKASKDPNLFATLLEDGAALTGLAFAALGVMGAGLFGWRWADGAASIAIGVLLLSVAVFLANETRSLIAGEAAADPIVEIVRRAADGCGDLGRLKSLKTLHLGPHSILVAIGWVFPEDWDRARTDSARGRLVQRIRAADARISDVLFQA